MVTLENIERIIDHEFQNTLLLWQALQGVRIPLPGFTDGNAFPDGNRRLVLLGRFAIGLAFTENVNSGAKDAESMYFRVFGMMVVLRYSFLLT